MARLQQTTNAKERIYAQSITFFSTNDSVLTALKASFTGMFGLHESTATLNAMKEGMSKSLETLSEIGDKVQEEAVRAGYGPTIRADAVKKLVNSVVDYQERAQEIIDEMRKASTQNSAEIRDAVEDGKRRDREARRRRQSAAALMSTRRFRAPRRTRRLRRARHARRGDARDGRGRHAPPSRAAGRARAQRGAPGGAADRAPARALQEPGHRGARQRDRARASRRSRRAGSSTRRPSRASRRTLATLWVKRATYGKWRRRCAGGASRSP